MVFASSAVLSRHFLEEPEENYENYLSGQSVSRPRLERDTFRVQDTSFNQTWS
jgi:hypothetical protein